MKAQRKTGNTIMDDMEEPMGFAQFSKAIDEGEIELIELDSEVVEGLLIEKK